MVVRSEWVTLSDQHLRTDSGKQSLVCGTHGVYKPSVYKINKKLRERSPKATLQKVNNTEESKRIGKEQRRTSKIIRKQ